MTSLTGCQAPGEKEAVGTMVGTIGGGVIGAQIGAAGGGRVAGAAIGAVAGGIAGNAIGRSLDEADGYEADMAFTRASRAPVGEVVYWNNIRTGNWGSYQPIREGHSRYGNYCRQYMTTVEINGRVERMYGTACRQPNGTWELL